MRCRKRGQAAMEFLMTYGWALLVVLIAIGALAFFGVLNPSKFLPNSCTLAPGFACVDFKASESSGNIQIVLQNGLGETLSGVRLEMEGASGAGSCDNILNTFAPSGFTLNDGGSSLFTLPCTGMNAGDKIKGNLQFAYTVNSGGSALSHTKIGQLVTGTEA
jgi:hypothetical protein